MTDEEGRQNQPNLTMNSQPLQSAATTTTTNNSTWTPSGGNPSIVASNQILGIVGGGNMGQSIAFPLFEKGLLNPQNVLVSASSDSTLQAWRKYGCRVSMRNDFVVQNSTFVIWAVKPQVFSNAVDSVVNNSNGKATFKEGVLHVSIMAGVPLDRFTEKLRRTIYPHHSSTGFRTIRVMPNIGLQVGAGVTVFTSSQSTLDSDRVLMYSIFQPIGLCYEVQESQMNAYCGLFGSGIGFMFPIIEALSDGAVKMGIPRTISLEIAAQVMVGAGQLYLQTKTHPGALKDQVCSPGGTTIAGVSELERGGIRNIVISAVEAATNRGDELAALVSQGPMNK